MIDDVCFFTIRNLNGLEQYCSISNEAQSHLSYDNKVYLIILKTFIL